MTYWVSNSPSLVKLGQQLAPARRGPYPRFKFFVPNDKIVDTLESRFGLTGEM